MSYQVVELLQLIFSLAAIFAAFLGGVAVGWWRWGRPPKDAVEAVDATPAPGLFSAHSTTDIRDPEVVGNRMPTFAATREIGVGHENN